MLAHHHARATSPDVCSKHRVAQRFATVKEGALRVALAFRRTSTAAALHVGNGSQNALQCRDLSLRRIERSTACASYTAITLLSRSLCSSYCSEGTRSPQDEPSQFGEQSTATTCRAVPKTLNQLSDPNTVCTPEGRRAAAESQAFVRAARRAQHPRDSSTTTGDLRPERNSSAHSQQLIPRASEKGTEPSHASDRARNRLGRC